MAARENCELFEHFYVRPEAYLDSEIVLPEAGNVAVSELPGIGFEPDPAVLEHYRA